MTITMYQASVPVFERYLKQLSAVLAQAANHAAIHGIDPDTLLQARLAPSMYPFATQVEIAANFSLRACAPLAGLEIPPYGEYAPGFEGLAQRIGKTLAFLASVTPAHMHGSEQRTMRSQAGQEAVALKGSRFLLEYALPNFFFHVTSAYAILRHMGVALGKSDYDGFHVYTQQSA